MSSIIKELSLTDLSELYKICYGDFETDAAGWDNSALIGTIRKNENFVGSRLEYAQLVDYGGGQSSGSLPASSTASMIRPVLFAKSVYATSVIDNQSMRAARRAGYNLGAFEDATKLSMDILKGSFSESVTRMFFGDGTGKLGEIQSVTVNSPGDYTLTITSASFIQANWMLNDLLNVDSGTSLFLVTALDIDPSVRTVRIVRQTGTDVPLVGQFIYKQKSKDQEMFGLKGVCDTTSGSLYGVPVGYRWKASTLDANDQAPSVKLFRELDQKIRFQSRGVMITDIIMSHTALRLFEDGEDAKSIIYVDPPVAPTIEAGSQVAAVKMNGRTVRISWSPYVEEDRAYFINRDKICLELRPDNNDDKGNVGGFLDSGNGIFFPLHVSGTPNDAYQMFWASYGNYYIPPTFVGCINNMATS
jgi:hypothetical protein